MRFDDVGGAKRDAVWENGPEEGRAEGKVGERVEFVEGGTQEVEKLADTAGHWERASDGDRAVGDFISDCPE